MTNTTYFHSVVRDEASTTTSSSCSSSSSSQQQVGAPSSTSSSSLYKVIGKALISLVSRRRGSNRNNENYYMSSGSFLPPSLLPGPQGENGNLESGNLMSLSFKELKTATRNFSPDFVLGEGGFGKVFKVWIDSNTLSAAKPGGGIPMAVKALNNGGFQGHREWLAEVNYLGWFNHPNLVRLYGYCLEDERGSQLLLYEFMPKGSLENQLFRRRSSSELSWSIRMKITLGAAKGLAFLHRADINVIHRGLKSSNILLDLNYNAKLSDFGFARDGPIDGRSHVTTRVMGTIGYAAPEYITTGHLTPKSDVHTFGVVLLELLTGRRAFEQNRPSRERNLVDWAKLYLKNKRKISRILDSQLMGQCSLRSVEKAANLALKCLASDAKLRPNMDEVVAELEQLQES